MTKSLFRCPDIAPRGTYFKHGMSGTPEYVAWKRARERCRPSGAHTKWHGQLGVRVCARWINSFNNFYADMGPRPSPKHSLDRWPDPNGDYCPENCRWATSIQQARNRRNTKMVQINTGLVSLAELVEAVGAVSHDVVFARLKLGWDLDTALMEPVRQLCRSSSR